MNCGKIYISILLCFVMIISNFSQAASVYAANTRSTDDVSITGDYSTKSSSAVLTAGERSTGVSATSTTAYYVDGVNGSNSNSGKTPSAAFSSIYKAYTALKSTGGIIYIVNTYSSSISITLSPTSYSSSSGTSTTLNDGCALEIRRYARPTAYASYSGFSKTSNYNHLFSVKSGGTLTLTEGLVIDGHRTARDVGIAKQDTTTGVVATKGLIEVQSGGKLVLDGGILQYSIGSTGAGVKNAGTFTFKSGAIDNCWAYTNTDGLGGGVNNTGTFTMTGGTISNCKAYSSSKSLNDEGYAAYLGYGGGVNNTGTFTMTGGTITGCATDIGGGVNNTGTMTLNGGTISDSTACQGGGIYNSRSATLKVQSGTISGNDANLENQLSATENYNPNIHGGGGISSYNSFTITGGTISGNSCDDYGGGGISQPRGTLRLSNATITGNTAAYGAGIYVCGTTDGSGKGSIIMSSGTVANNTVTKDGSNGGGIYISSNTTNNEISGEVSGNSSCFGAGVFIAASAAATISGTIKNNTATYGGGIYNNGGTISLSGTVSGNSGYGGGVYNRSSGTFTLTGTISGNTNGSNAGVYNAGTFNINGGTISGNKATASNRGGIYNSGTLTLSSGSITANTARANGSGVYNEGTFNMSGGSISNNSANSFGGGVYNHGGTFNMSGGSISGNTADIGKGVYNRATFNMSGSATVNSNNDIYLYSDCFVTVTGALSASTAGTITPNSYTYGRVCIRTAYSGAVASTVINKFALTPKGSAFWVAGDTLDSSSSILDTDVVISAGYAIIYNSNLSGVTVSNMPENQTKIHDKTITISSLLPSALGYRFDGWNSAANGSGNTIAAGSSYSTNSALTLYAQWSPNTYTVTYDGNGGTGVPAAQDFVFGSGDSISTVVPTKVGYKFVNWKTTHDGSYFNPGDSIPTGWGSFTLVAQWEPIEYTVRYNDGFNLLTGLDDKSTSTSDRMQYSINNGVVSVTALYNDGYGFTPGRVYLEAGKTYLFTCDTSGTWGSASEAFLMLDGAYSTYYHMASNNYTFTPTVTGTYWLRLDVNANGTTETFFNISIVEGKTPSNVTGYTQSSTHTFGIEKSLMDNGFSRTGYAFIGWNTKQDGSGKSFANRESVKNLSDENGKTITLYAMWKDVGLEIDVENDEGLKFYEGEIVKKEDLLADLSAKDGEGNDLTSEIRITKIEYSAGKLLPDGTKTSSLEVVEWESDMPDDDLLDTWFLQLDKEDSPVTHKIYYEVTDSWGNTVVLERDVQIIYNEFPEIKGENYYFTVQDAQEGKITYDVLLEKARAWDLEDCTEHCPNGEHDGENCLDDDSQCEFTAENIKILEWDEDLFKNYTDKGYAEPGYQVLTYHITDQYGKETFKQFAVYIINDGDIDDNESDVNVRFIDWKNYQKDNEEEGGLHEESLWYKDSEYVNLISPLLQGIHQGTITAESSWTFDYGELDDVKEYIETNGIGNSLNINGLAGFIAEFK